MKLKLRITTYAEKCKQVNWTPTLKILKWLWKNREIVISVTLWLSQKLKELFDSFE